MEKDNDRELLQKCLAEIEQQLGWGSAETWHSDIFNELSEKIHASTSVMLSPTTLKRVWGKVKYNSAPSISTLNTLSQFAGFENWRAFKTSQSITTETKSFPLPVEENNEATPHFQRKVMFGAMALLVTALISFFAIGGESSEPSHHEALYGGVQFDCRRVTDDLPTSVVFDFDLNRIASDSMYIQQFWDPRRTIKVAPGQTQATGIYYFPGYFRARLLIDQDTVVQRDLFIKSGGWAGTIDYQPVPKYLSPSEFKTDSCFELSPAILREIAHSEERLTTTYHLIDEFEGISGDNFQLEAHLQNVYHEKWAVCESAGVYVIGSKGALIIPFSALGCISNNDIMLNDVFVDGRKNDLSAFGVGLSESKKVSISNENREVTVQVEGQVIYKESYRESLGDFVGMRFKFLGAGKVSELRLEGSDGKALTF